MGSNKNRLYIALYPSGVANNEERKYHWGFLIGPKNERNPPIPGTRYHVKNRFDSGWMYEEMELDNVQSTNSLLARIAIAKITDEQRLVDIIRNTQIVQNDPNWRCRTWVATCLSRIKQDGQCVGTAQLDWSKIESKARKYVAEKTAAGKYGSGADLRLPKPTFDMMEDKEIIS